MAQFTFSQTAGDGGFKFREQSIFRDGLSFTITGAKTGVWQDETGNVVNKDGSNSIRLTTSLGEEINLNRFLNKKRVVYSDTGRASILYDAEFRSELLAFLETKIGRNSTNSAFLNGTAKSVADRLVAEFFAGKTIVCKKAENVFFKTVKDGVERLEAPYDDIVTFAFS